MFRRSGKHPFEEEEASNYKYSAKKSEPPELPPRLFDSPLHSPLVSPMEEREESWKEEKISMQKMVEEEPETTLGEGVIFRGELSFERLLRIDGTFEGELLSQGKVIVGPKGKVKANINLREAIIEGEVVGNITVEEKLHLRGEASVQGDIRAKSLCVDEGVRIVGHLHISPLAS